MRPVQVTLTVRDVRSDAIISENSVIGFTENDGMTVVIQEGLLPGLNSAKIEDVKIEVLHPSSVLAPTKISVIDSDSGNQVIVLY